MERRRGERERGKRHEGRPELGRQVIFLVAKTIAVPETGQTDRVQFDRFLWPPTHDSFINSTTAAFIFLASATVVVRGPPYAPSLLPLFFLSLPSSLS